jgi:hypothetical protein
MLILKWYQMFRSLEGWGIEFAAVFLLLNKAFRQLFQLQVWTTFLGSQANITGGKYPPAGTITDGFGAHF